MFARLNAYIDSVIARDPAPRSRMEVMLYPGLWAMVGHRIAHRLFRARWYFFARLVNHFTRWATGIDIHPGATIGRHFFVDHGWVVIGETAEIGDNVTMYSCVTLGGTNPTNGKGGKRHPTLSDNVIVGSGAQILGPIVIGPRARVGANAVVTDDVPEGITMVGVKARSTLVATRAWGQDFAPYGTPCSEPCIDTEPAVARLAVLEGEVEMLRADIARLTGEAQDGPQGPGRRTRRG
jgi:serine O-acetyltransferase